MARTSGTIPKDSKRDRQILEILEENGFDLEQVDFLDVVDDETAEIYGYDTY